MKCDARINNAGLFPVVLKDTSAFSISQLCAAGRMFYLFFSASHLMVKIIIIINEVQEIFSQYISLTLHFLL